MQGNALEVREQLLPSEAEVLARMVEVRAFQILVHKHMIVGHDYGKIPGTDKPTLLKPGAEKIAKLMKLADTYEIISETVDWDRPLFAYTVRCRLVSMETGVLYSEGLGECNSHETKYRYRQSLAVCPSCNQENVRKSKGSGFYCWQKTDGCGANFPGDDERITSQNIGRVENEDVADQKNTFLKMAKKRALVDAALSAGRLSDIFTQDIEELRGDVKVTVEPAQEAPAAKPPTKARQRPAQPRDAQGHPAAPAEADAGPDDAVKPVLESFGDLMDAVHAKWGKGRHSAAVCDALRVENPVDIDDFSAAWAKLVAKWG